MAVEIPLLQNPSYSFIVSLEGVTYDFQVRYNDREESWRLDIRDLDKTPIVQGIKLLPNQSITSQYVNSELFTGNLYFIDVFGKVTRPTFDSLGKRHKLFYITREEEDELRETL